MLVELTANKDYLRRIDRVMSDATDGITKEELDRASIEAEEQIMIAMATIGFSISGWTNIKNTPGTVIELIRLLGSAKVWHRVLLEYGNDTAFDETYGATLFERAEALLESVQSSRTLISPTSNRTLITPSAAESGKGLPKMALPASAEMITDDSLDYFIRTHGPDRSTREQRRPGSF